MFSLTYCVFWHSSCFVVIMWRNNTNKSIFVISLIYEHIIYGFITNVYKRWPFLNKGTRGRGGGSFSYPFGKCFHGSVSFEKKNLRYWHLNELNESFVNKCIHPARRGSSVTISAISNEDTHLQNSRRKVSNVLQLQGSNSWLIYCAPRITSSRQGVTLFYFPNIFIYYIAITPFRFV